MSSYMFFFVQVRVLLVSGRRWNATELLVYPATSTQHSQRGSVRVVLTGCSSHLRVPR